MVLFESLGTICNSPSTVTMALSYIISEIKLDIGRKLQFFHTPAFDAPIRRVRVDMLLALTEYANVTDRWTDEQTDTARWHRPFHRMLMHSIARHKSPDFDEIWYTTADLILGESHVTKYQNFKNSRWRTAQHCK